MLLRTCCRASKVHQQVKQAQHAAHRDKDHDCTLISNQHAGMLLRTCCRASKVHQHVKQAQHAAHRDEDHDCALISN